MRVPSVFALSLCLAACAPAVSTGANASSQPVPSDASSASLAPTATLLPGGFAGRWDADLAACHGNSDMKLTITQTELTFWESTGQITGVIIKTPSDVTVKAAFSGEGEQWNRDLHLVLSHNGQTLKVDDTSRVRCP
ncbi:hypothetical protein [Asticcacaulis sp. 201]|uniref:hypothetical protein n=1 Tax=Asticcacaulis sp. 201 TaxID=3028787 RepID=UPI0029161F20|nr:hypothetical protein [Asticcacaulis sp. 201]MDV6329453.1 hypothetical protein [Asticcacaulis sp. 201]